MRVSGFRLTPPVAAYNKASMMFPPRPNFSVRLLLALCLAPLFSHAGTVEKIEYNSVDAYRITDGKTEAVVVPSFSGRIMRYGAVGGANWMWNSPAEKLTGKGYQNYGGDKTFAGPHPFWGAFESVWPPDPTWDGPAHVAEVLPEGRLKTTGNIWRGFGVRIIREFSYSAAGELVVTQTIDKVEGEPRQLAVWPVTQTAPPDAVYIPLNPNSAYTRGYHPFGGLPASAQVETLAGTTSEGSEPGSRSRLLKITPTVGTGYKLGTDSLVASIAAVKGDAMFLQRGEKLKGQYPDGAEGSGMSVEFYNHWDKAPNHFVELELLSALKTLKVGGSLTFTSRWSLHNLPSDPQEKLKTIEILLNEQPK